MKLKNVFLASLLGKLGVEVKAELVIDDASGTTLTFPDISDIAEIAEGVAIDAPDGTYVIANGPESITLVVASGVVTSKTVDMPAPVAEVETELQAETQVALEAIVEEIVALRASHASVVAELKDLKTSLKHDVEVPAAAAAADAKKPQFKMIG
jgi:hypothetical protein